MMKKIVFRALGGIQSGVATGLLISVGISYFLDLSDYYPAPPRFVTQFDNQVQALIASILIWAAIGGVFSCTHLIFTEVDWSITKMTLAHFMVTYSLFLPLSILAGWYPISTIDIVIFTIYFIVIYLIIWIISMIKARKDIAKINDIL